MPKKDAIQDILLDDKGPDILINMAKLPNKKGLKNAVDTTKDLSEGKEINLNKTTEEKEKIKSNAKKAHEALSAYLDEVRSEMQPEKMKGKIQKILDTILEEKDMDRFKEFIGTKEITNQRNSREKIKAIKSRQTDIEDFISGKEEEFYWVNTKGVTLETLETPPTYVKGDTKRTVSEEFGKDLYVTTLPEKMSAEDFKKMNDWITHQKKTESPRGYKKIGRVRQAPLVQVFGLLTSQAAQAAQEKYKNKQLQVQINEGNDALNYLKLLTKQRWRKSSAFIPSPNLDSAGAVNSARKRIFMPHGKVIIPQALQAMLVNAELDINALMEEGVKQTKEKLIPNHVKMVLTGELKIDLDELNIDAKIFKDLQTELKNSKEMGKFLKKIKGRGGKQNEALNIIIDLYVDKQNMFTEDEAQKISGMFKDLDTPGKLSRELQELYGKDADTIADSLFDVMEDIEDKGLPLFNKVGEFYKLNLIGIEKMEADRLMRDLRNLRSKEESVSTRSNTVWDKIEEEYDEEYELSSVGGLNALDIFHILALLDWYYGQTDLYEKIQDWKNPDEYEEEDVLFDEVQAAAIENFSEIMGKFVEATKKKVEDIVTTPTNYQDKLVYVAHQRDREGKKTGEYQSKATLMIEDLKEAGVVAVVG
tara:strand:+ start:19762 stop:21702 length:1941 start_codon:yes stop_codon:yes gene_type:complete